MCPAFFNLLKSILSLLLSPFAFPSTMKIASRLLCVSANPAIDRRVAVPNFRSGAVNRARSVDPAAGGKAAHVAFAAKALGADVRWLAFVGGAEGESCRQEIAARGVEPLSVKIAGRTRTNLELIDESSGEITEVLEPGPSIREEEQAEFLRRFDEELKSHPVVVISGSLPGDVRDSFYRELITRARNADCIAMLDTSGEALSQSLTAAPDLIKPNRDEAGVLLGIQISSIAEAVQAARSLRQRGPRAVILSLGSEGAVAVGDSYVLHARAPVVNAISTVGSGDSFLAGWAVGVASTLSPDACLRLAIACGTANCLASSPGVISNDEVQRLLEQVEISRV